MSLISRAINHLFGGVSQQAAALRDPSQCELMVNCWPDVAQGLGKRPPLIHGVKLNTTTSTARKIHQINRDSGEKYAVTLANGAINVYDRVTGSAKTVNTPDGVGYLTSSDPANDFVLLTVADTTFIANRSIVTAMNAAASYTPHNEYFVNVVTAVVDAEYVVRLDGIDYKVTAGSGATWTRTNTVSTNLVSTINAGGIFTATLYGADSPLLKIVKTAGGTFTAEVTDSYGDTALVGFRDTLEHESKLPTTFWADFIIKIGGALDGEDDDYYVTFDTTDKVWRETVKGGLQNTFTPSTMPHKLVRNADGTFTFSKITWTSREVGDEDTNPTPSFVGKVINNIFFYRERFGMLSGENLIMSRVADYYTFWNTSASGQLDDDPIDVAVADVKVSYLYHALPFQETLLVFSDNAQYQVSGGDILSASTIRLDPTTRFSVSKTTPPAAAGRNVFFAVDKGDYSSVREYFVMPDTSASDALDVTAHAPAYVPQNLRTMDASSLSDCLIAVSGDSGNELFVYKFLWEADKKVQSSWGKWVLDSDANVMSIAFDGSSLSLIVVRSDGTYVESIDLQTHNVEAGMDRSVYLDRRFTLTGSYSSGTGKTTWTLPHNDDGEIQVVLGSGYGSQAGLLLETTKVSPSVVTAVGDYSAHSCFVGKPYEMRYRFSELFLKDDKGIALQSGRLQLRSITLSFSDTGYFRVEVTPKNRQVYSYSYTARIIGSVSATIGSNPINTSKHRFPIVTNSNGLTLDIVNDSPSPSFFQGAEWEGLYSQRTKRV